MTDRNIRRVALVVIGLACAGSAALAATSKSVLWGVVASWLLFALVVETAPKSE